MAIRIKSKWSKTVKRAKTTDDVASALSYIGWKISLDKAKTCMVKILNTLQITRGLPL